MLKTITKYLSSKNFDLLYLLSNGGISLIFRLIGTLLGFAIIWIITHFFSNNTYGGFVIIQTIIQVFVILFSLGVQNVLIIELSKNKDQKELHFNILLKSTIPVIIATLIPMALFYLFSESISSSVFQKPQLAVGFKILSYALLTFVLHDVVLYYFIAKKQFIRFGFFMFVLPNLLFIVFLFYHSNQQLIEEDLIHYYFLSFLITLLVESFLILFEDFSTKKTETSVFYILKTGLPMMFSGILMYLLNWIDVLMLGSMVSKSEVGIYNVAFKIGFFVLIIIASVNVIIGPAVSELYQKQKLQELKNFIQQTTKIITLITLPIVLVIVIFNKYILQIFGAEFSSQGNIVLIIITLGTFINAASGNVDQILNMTGSQNILFRINFTALIVNILCNLFLIPLYGITGAAIASFISTVFMNFTSLMFIKKKLGFFTISLKNT